MLRSCSYRLVAFHSRLPGGRRDILGERPVGRQHRIGEVATRLLLGLAAVNHAQNADIALGFGIGRQLEAVVIPFDQSGCCVAVKSENWRAPAG